jgi:putative ABC transport system permease protein
MPRLLDDLRFAARQLLRRPSLTIPALITLALGTGAATAIFSIVDGVLLRPLPFPDSGRLVALCETHASIEGYCVASPPNVEDWAAGSRTLTALGLGRSWSMNLSYQGSVTGLSGGLATPGLFTTLGIRPALGRLFAPGDLAESGRRVVVLSDAVWRGTFAADRSVVGRTVALDGESYAVIGVLPPNTEVPTLGYVKLWVPLPFDPRDEDNRRWRGFATFGRLAPGVSPEDAQAELNALQRQLGERYPRTNQGWGARVVPLLDHVVGRVRPTLLVFLGAVAILLLVSCANVANLLVAGAAAREREFAVRVALGARPRRLFRLLAVESALLALLGGAAGILAAMWAADALLALMPAALPRLDSVTLDARVLVFALLLTVATAVATGVAPALRAARLSVAEAIKEGHQPQAWRRALGVRGGLVVAEVALAFVLAVGAGLLARSFASLLDWRPGFEQRGVLTFWTYASSGKYPDRRRVTDLFERLERELAALPGVASAGMTSAGPLFGGGDGAGEFTVEGGDAAQPPIVADWYNVSPGYFPTLGVALRAGRMFTATDREEAPAVAILNETAARRYFGPEGPVGSRLRMKDGRAMEVVGVVADVLPFTPGEPARPEIYWPYHQSPRWASYFVLRTAGDPAALAPLVKTRLAAIDPELAASQVATMEDLVNGELKRPRFNMLLITVFAGLALTLAIVGVYGVIAASVEGRRRELGVRLALGASGRQLVGMVMREGMLLAAVGLAIGAAVALAVSRFARALLYSIQPTDPPTYLAIAFVLALATLAACVIPARRASRVDPMQALRSE